MEAGERLYPGYTKHLVEMREIDIRIAEEQIAHRMELEKTVINGDNSRANWGIATAFIIALAGIGTSGFLVMHGHDVAGTVFGGTTFAGLVSTFIYGTNSRRDERLKKAELMTGREPKKEKGAA